MSEVPLYMGGARNARTKLMPGFGVHLDLAHKKSNPPPHYQCVGPAHVLVFDRKREIQTAARVGTLIM